MAHHEVQTTQESTDVDTRLSDLSYESRKPGRTIDEDRLEHCCPLDNGRHEEKKPPSSVSMGLLDMLPPEIWNMIFVDLDLCSLTQLRSVNSRVRNAVGELPEYKSIVAHTPNVLRAALSLDIARSISCRALYNGLAAPKCSLCGDFGGYFSFLLCCRVCFLCIMNRPETCPSMPHLAQADFGLDTRTVSRLPALLSLPGFYSPQDWLHSERMVLVDREMARQAGVLLHGSCEAMEKSLEGEYEKKMTEWRKAPEDKRLLMPMPPAHWKPLIPGSLSPSRYMGVIRAPWYNRQDKILERGLQCKRCQRRMPHRNAMRKVDRELDESRMFARADFLAHLDGLCKTTRDF